MDSFELTKIAGAVLCALLAIVAPHTAIQIAEEEQGKEMVGYKLPEPAPDAKGGAGAGKTDAKTFDPAAVVALLPTAKAGHGSDIAKKCEACHTLDKGGAVKVGPNLWGVVGRPIASVAGFAYSSDLKAKGGDWTFDNLAAFVHHPKSFAPGTKMGFPGLPSPNDLADVLAYLNTQTDKPLPLPATAKPKSGEAAAQKPAGANDAEAQAVESKKPEANAAEQPGQTAPKGGAPAEGGQAPTPTPAPEVQGGAPAAK